MADTIHEENDWLVAQLVRQIKQDGLRNPQLRALFRRLAERAHRNRAYAYSCTLLVRLSDAMRHPDYRELVDAYGDPYAMTGGQSQTKAGPSARFCLGEDF